MHNNVKKNNSFLLQNDLVFKSFLNKSETLNNEEDLKNASIDVTTNDTKGNF